MANIRNDISHTFTGEYMLSKALYLLSFQILFLFGCKDNEPVSANPSDKIEFVLPETLSSESFSYTIPIHHTDKYKDVNWEDISAYLGDYHPNNWIGNASFDGSSLYFTLPTEISTENIFTAYKNYNYNNLDCKPENLAVSRSSVRFFSTKNNRKQYELILGIPIVNNPDLFKKEFYIYFWTIEGTVTGKNAPYTCNFNTKPGWNITEIDGRNMTTIKHFQGETTFNVIKRIE